MGVNCFSYILAPVLIIQLMETLSAQTIKTFPVNIPPHSETTEPVDEHMKRVLIKATNTTEENRIFLVFVSREHAERLLEIVSKLMPNVQSGEPLEL